MATLDDFRTITQKFDEVSDYAPDIIANSADMQGRILRVEFTSAGEPITSNTATAKLLWNPSGTNEQLWVNSADMQRVSDAATLTFTVPLPTGVTQAKTDCVPMCVELADNGQTVATRNFHVRVDKAVGDTIGTGNVNIGQAAADAKAAAASAAASAKSAEGSATRANESATAADGSKTAAAGSAEAAGQARSAALASAKEASVSERDAAESASRAGGSASAAAGSAEAAGRSAADARAAVDGFGLTVGGVTTVAPGGEATASVTKDGTRYTLALGIPKGDKGDKGDKGENTAAIRSVAATVDSSTGTPTVDVESGGTPEKRELTFNFHNLRGERGEKGDGADLRPATAANLGGVKIPGNESGLIIDEGGQLRVNLGPGINIDSSNSVSLSVPRIVDHTEITYGGAEMAIDVWSLSPTECRVDFYGKLVQSGGLMANVRIPLSSGSYYAHGNYIAVSGRIGDVQTAVIGVTVSDGQITFDQPYMSIAIMSGSILVKS